MALRGVRFIALAALALLSLSFAGRAAEPDSSALEKRGAAVGALVAQASSTFGEQLWVNPSIAEERVTVTIRPADAATFARTLDLLPGYQWTEGALPDGTTFRVLGPDWGERSLWENLAAAEALAKRQAQAQADLERFNEFTQALGYTVQQLDALAEEDPSLVWAMSQPLARAMIAYLAQFPQEQQEALFAVGSAGLSVPFASLPVQVQAAVTAWLARQSEGRRSRGPGGGQAAQTAADPSAVRFMNAGEGLEFAVMVGEAAIGETLTRPRDLYPEFYRMALRMQSGMPDERARALQGEELAAMREQRREAAQREREARLVSDPPRFGTEHLPQIALESPLVATATYAALENLADRAGLALACHYFDRDDRALDTRFDEGQTVAVVLDDLADRMEFLWGYQDGVVVATSPRLAGDLASEIPASTLRKWRERAAGGRLSLDNLAEMAGELSPEQRSNLPFDLMRAGAGGVRTRPEHFLFYGSLDAAQRQAARSQGGLAYASLSAEQQALFIGGARSTRPAQQTAGAAPGGFRIEERTGPRGIALLYFVYEFKDAPAQEAPLLALPQAPEPSAAEREEAPSQASDAGPAIPTEPPGMEAAGALARWAFVERRATIAGEPIAILMSRSDGQPESCILGIGDEIEGAVVARIESDPERLILRAGDVEIRLPRSRAVSLAPPKGSALLRRMPTQGAGGNPRGGFAARGPGSGARPDQAPRFGRLGRG